MVLVRLEAVTGTHRVGAAAINYCGTTDCYCATTACAVGRAAGTRTYAPARSPGNGSRGSDARARRAAKVCGSGTRRSRTPGRNDCQIIDHSADCRSVPDPDADRRMDVRARDRRARPRV